eukprot:762052-Hanusia_phi.AAC.6
MVGDDDDTTYCIYEELKRRPGLLTWKVKDRKDENKWLPATPAASYLPILLPASHTSPPSHLHLLYKELTFILS